MKFKRGDKVKFSQEGIKAKMPTRLIQDGDFGRVVSNQKNDTVRVRWDKHAPDSKISYHFSFIEKVKVR